MASFTLTDSQVFPAGTTVGAYPLGTFPGPPPAWGQTPGAASPVASAVMNAEGRATLEGLAAGVKYWVGGLVLGSWRWVSIFTTPIAPNVGPEGPAGPKGTTGAAGASGGGAAGSLKLCAALNRQGVLEARHGPLYIPLFQRYWDVLVCENECKIEKTFSSDTRETEEERRTKPGAPDVHLLTEMLAAVGTATPLHFHTFIWHVNNPVWLSNPLVAWTETSLRAAAKLYIQSTLSAAIAGGAKVVSVDVINEVLTSATKELRSTFWTEHFGGSLAIVKTNPAVRFYAECFKWVYEILPGVPLFYNDASLELDSQYEAGKAGKEKGLAALKLVEVLKEVLTELGVPLSLLGVGFECHRETGTAGVNYPSTAELARHIRQFQALGCHTRVSELDIKIKEGDSLAMQAEAVAAIVAVAELTGSEIGTWGMTNASTFQGGATELWPNPVTLPAATIEVLSTTGFAATGEVVVDPFGASPQTVKYTGVSGSFKLTGCTGGTGEFAAATPVVAKPPDGPRPLFWSADLIPEALPSWGPLAAARSGSGPVLMISTGE